MIRGIFYTSLEKSRDGWCKHPQVEGRGERGRGVSVMPLFPGVVLGMAWIAEVTSHQLNEIMAVPLSDYSIAKVSNPGQCNISFRPNMPS